MYLAVAKIAKSRLSPRWVLGLCALLGVVAGDPVFASPSVAQAIGVANQIVDEFGRPLHGTEPASSRFGITPVEGDMVQVLHATDGVIYPPAKDGTPDPRNVLLKSSRIGLGMRPFDASPAKFAATLSPRPSGNTKLFVRVFNAADLEEASFYGDSQLFTVKSWKNEIFTAQIAATSEPLDAGDDDGDGLSNSMEQSYGSDLEATDTDGDGMSDYEESIAGTDILDPASLFVFNTIQTYSGSGVTLSWESTPGTTYRVDVTSDPLSGNPEFEVLETLVATDAVSECLIPNEIIGNSGCFRVCVVP